jgi:Raf kinase inhibitor-like YbhB/YbcL family protein
MRSLIVKITASVAFAALLAAPAIAQNQGDGDGPPVLANKIVTPRNGGIRLLFSATAFNSNSQIPETFTQNGENVSPALQWSRGQAGTQSYAIFVEDGSVNRHDPIVHWIIYNIPGTVTHLQQAVPVQATLENGAQQAKNVRGQNGYVGPKPPAGQTHTYHFEIFALNSYLHVDPANADRKAVLDAMRNHVISTGEFAGNYTGK